MTTENEWYNSDIRKQYGIAYEALWNIQARLNQITDRKDWASAIFSIRTKLGELEASERRAAEVVELESH